MNSKLLNYKSSEFDNLINSKINDQLINSQINGKLINSNTLIFKFDYEIKSKLIENESTNKLISSTGNKTNHLDENNQIVETEKLNCCDGIDQKLSESNEIQSCPKTELNSKYLFNDLIKYSTDINLPLIRLYKFDERIHSIDDWFLNYELYGLSLNWTDKELYDNLSIYLDQSLKHIYLNNENSYQLSKYHLIKFMNCLLYLEIDNIYIKVKEIIKLFNDYKLRINDRKRYLNYYRPINKIISYLDLSNCYYHHILATFLRKYYI